MSEYKPKVCLWGDVGEVPTPSITLSPGQKFLLSPLPLSVGLEFSVLPPGLGSILDFVFPALKRWALLGRPPGLLSCGLGWLVRLNVASTDLALRWYRRGSPPNQRQDQHQRQERCWKVLWFPPFAKEAKDGAPHFCFVLRFKASGPTAVAMT